MRDWYAQVEPVRSTTIGMPESMTLGRPFFGFSANEAKRNALGALSFKRWLQRYGQIADTSWLTEG